MRTAGISAALAVTLAAGAGAAHADSAKAWAAAKAGLPGDAKLVVGVDFAAIQKTQLFATFYPKLRDKPEVARVLDTMKTSCKLDPLTNVAGVVVATAGDESDGAVYLAMTGVDKAKLSSCLQAAGKSAGSEPAKVSIKQDGNVTQVTEGADTAFFGWVGKDVIVVPLHAQDKAALTRWMGGKGALGRSDLGRTIAKVNTAAAMWGASEVTKEVQPGVTVKGGYGAVTFANGNLDADVHAVMQSTEQAQTMAGTANKQLTEVKQSTQLPQPIAAMLKSVTVTAARDEVVIKASVIEKDLMSVLAMALGGLGGS